MGNFLAGALVGLAVLLFWVALEVVISWSSSPPSEKGV